MARGLNSGRLLPLFPLQLVVFPGSATPLHIFEERYREMVGEAETAGTEFGIVLVKDGGIVNSGCTVVVETVLKRYDDGRFDVMTRGQRRFLIQAINQDKEYLRGDVEYFNDEAEELAPPELRHQALAAHRELRKALDISGETATPNEASPLLSFELAEAIDDLDFRNAIQRNRSETERLRFFADFTAAYIERRQYAAKMKRTAPLNGHGHKRVAE